MITDLLYKKMSNAEREVAEYLNDLGVTWLYEQPVYVKDEKDRPRLWTPDFYLPVFGIYVEVCGSEEFDYGYRWKIYENSRLFIIFVHTYKEKNRWQKHLKELIIRVTESRYAKVKEMVENSL